MIYVTGDIHGGVDINKLSNKNLKKSDITLTNKDYVIILGDFGLPFLDEDVTEKDGEYHYWIKWLSEKPYTILWIDGNHDNFNYWDKQKVTEWHGGQVQIHPDAPNVIHLMRGEIYDIDGKKFFAFGGAASHDKELRTLNVSWWEQEIASDEDIKNAIRNLENNDFKVDYVLTHTPPLRIMNKLYRYPDCDKTAEFLNVVLVSVEYKLWLCGHIHLDCNFENEKIKSLYNTI